MEEDERRFESKGAIACRTRSSQPLESERYHVDGTKIMMVFMEPKERSNTEYKLKTMIVSTGNLQGEMLFSGTSHNKFEDMNL
ncbi:hypothetical protein F2Q68_00031665 [Brassica cretica]|uniref:Uncharacterized protein n=1 Tax=Brassica cretica TaxID=69181 RepID=A0A8S9GFS2_BRACR|nr:hypothetical protein F2Q68_00031665 [Brassica cretica]